MNISTPFRALHHPYTLQLYSEGVMPDSLYLSLWFPSLDPEEMLPRMISVLKQCPFSSLEPGVKYAAAHPIAVRSASARRSRSEPLR